MKTITVLNRKGGSGKSSSCFHLGGTLAAKGLRVLLIDNDPQASLTQGFWGPSIASALDPQFTVAACFDGEPDPTGLVAETGCAGLWIVPGSEHGDANMRSRDLWSRSQWGLRGLVDELDDRFDVCLIDCPPNLHLCSWAALLAADGVVVPLQPEDFGSQGLDPVTSACRAAATVNMKLRLLGYLLTIVDKRLGVHQAYEGMLRELYGDLVFSNVVPRAKDFVEAVGARRPVSSYKPKSVASKAIREVAEELLGRVGVVPTGKGVAASAAP